MYIEVGSGGLGGESTSAGYTHDLLLIIGGLVTWIGCSSIHFLYAERFINHIDATTATCESQCIEPEDIDVDATEEEEEAFNAALEKYDACKAKCAAEAKLSEKFQCSADKDAEDFE